jgi:hypothetical protein
MNETPTDPAPPDQAQTVQIPDFVVRQVGALQLQLAAANETIQQQAQELAALKASKAQGTNERT